VYSFQSNVNSTQTALTNGLQIYRRSPQAGMWLLDLEVTSPVSGAATSSTFSAQVAYNTVKIKAAGLPHSAGTHLAAGVPITVPVTVKNTGVVPVTYFADGRLNQTGTLDLAELSGNATTPLPVPAGVTPFWLVPTEVTQLNGQAVADQPVNMDFNFESGNPDVYGAAVGNGASVQVNAAMVSPGIWLTDIGQTGPFSGAAPAGTVTASVSAIGQLFDTAVSSDTGDFWQEGVAGQSALAARAQLRTSGERLLSDSGALAPKATPALNSGPMTLDPGQSGTITVTITPSGATGTVVSGNLYIDSVDGYTLAGDELIDLPYSYTIS
jgi:hypothetical protein